MSELYPPLLLLLLPSFNQYDSNVFRIVVVVVVVVVKAMEFQRMMEMMMMEMIDRGAWYCTPSFRLLSIDLHA
jgi:hypothetical protein